MVGNVEKVKDPEVMAIDGAPECSGGGVRGSRSGSDVGKEERRSPWESTGSSSVITGSLGGVTSSASWVEAKSKISSIVGGALSRGSEARESCPRLLRKSFISLSKLDVIVVYRFRATVTDLVSS